MQSAHPDIKIETVEWTEDNVRHIHTLALDPGAQEALKQNPCRAD